MTGAFARRQFVVPWQGCRPIDEAAIDATLDFIFGTPRTEPTVAYVHVPYCQNHCLFCGFFQNVWRPEASAAYVADVVAEMERVAGTPLVASGPIEAVYIGGGTPSALHADDLMVLVESLGRILPLAPDCEITVEGRVHDFGLSKAVAALDAGANRVSLGIQSFDTRVRQRLGRKASGREARAFLADLVGLDRAVIGCDLIYGLPGQDDAVWRADVEAAIELGLHGLSIYALNVWPGGPLSRAIDNGKLPAAGPLPAQATAYAHAVETLTAHGWRQISQAHFARSPRERNRYNRLIKEGANCLAFGPGAGGHAHGFRWRNTVDIARRRALVAQGRRPIEGLSRLPVLHRARTAVVSGLEDGDLDIEAVEAAAPGFLRVAAPLLADWVDAGLGEMRSGRFRTTRAGAFWMTTLATGLHAVLDRLVPTESRPEGAPA
ncbi:heme anaerobic degradation radical SAM methyltransferase ChuW/HutW [Chelatococcus sp. SYSU_G07232]|uniref:Heme anaerobic degradation radical SAM methyltransferase ChuW/HutW n=1 Tax=Chelatococcus albus TaxID=3047466 RepID=A0ABT7AL26_9HYPH|nr:heme anaerobic degradation radical SAM methyltransferase ChuW/HutW [Chelatococcus sp. SYSU_G07232]MDJ1160070.1 heme anaerobic degradation radical SAM methyltransferase ChuW/HutW [Chelatococcus sp. SYSU_G07232]